MPYASKAQGRYFHFLESRGKMPKKTVREFDDETDFEEIPERVEGYAKGGFIAPEDHFDWDEGHASSYVSSGEPGTEDELEGDHPMPYMDHGPLERGRHVRRMAKGGMVHKANFVKALRKAY